MSNLFERALGVVAPGWALSRAQARTALQIVFQHEARRAKLGYDANRVGRRTSNWVAGGTSANAEMQPALSRVRNRSRDLVRNNPYARSALNALVSRAIGTGIMAYPPANVLPVWKEFVEQSDYEGQHDFYGQQSLIGRTVFESGECLVRRMRGSNVRAPLQIQVLEPDYLDNLRFGAVGEDFVIAGIQIDRGGRRRGYWMFDHHPGEVGFATRSLISKFVPASEILHVYEKERPGQLRGMPRLAVSMLRLHDVDDYQDAVMMLKKIAACFAAFVTSPAGSTRTVVESTTNPESGKREEQLAPGMIWYGNPGEDVKFGSLGAISRDEYTNDQLHAIATGIGVTYEQLTGDRSQVTYLSSRSAMIDFKALVEMFQWINFIPMACNGVARWFVDAYYTSGRLRTDRYDFNWTTPAWPLIDPEKDIAADRDEVRAGFASQSEKIRARGRDPEQVRKEMKADLDANKADGLTVDSDAAVPVSKGLPAPVDAGAPKPAADATPVPAKAEKQSLAPITVSAPFQLHVAMPDIKVELHQAGSKTDVHVPPAAPVTVKNEVNPTPVTVTVNNEVQPAPVEVKVELPGELKITSLPDRETTSEIKRNSKGEITETTQVEKDA